MSKDKQPNYWDYIRVEELLALQGGLDSDESLLTNEEVMFITVHQVFELWFKLILRELRTLRDRFKGEVVDEQELSEAVRSIRRVHVLLGRCADHFAVMETLPTREYLAFRDKLAPASGFQSAQMRQIEILMGIEAAQRIPLGDLDGDYLEALRDHDGRESPALRRVKTQLEDRPSVKQVVDDWIYRTPIDGSTPDDPGDDKRVADFIEDYLGAHSSEVDAARELALKRTLTDDDRTRVHERFEKEKAAVRALLLPGDSSAGEAERRERRIRSAMLFITTYRELPLLAWPREVLDGLIEMEQAFLIFRQRHARMVERIIGRRTGTGGSSGVDYLDQTALTYRIFSELWTIRTLQIQKEAAPALRAPDFYGFRNG